MISPTNRASTRDNRTKAEPTSKAQGPKTLLSPFSNSEILHKDHLSLIPCHTYAHPTNVSIPFPDIPVCAGFPSPAADFVENNIDLNELLIKHPAATFFIRVEGNSMIGAGILPGDILIVDRSLEPYHNTIVIAILNGEFTVKRLQKQSTQIVLAPENPKYQPIQITPESDFEVWGVVTHVIHNTNSQT